MQKKEALCMKRIFSLLLAAVLLLGCFPAAASAAEPDLLDVMNAVPVPVASDLPGSDELFAAYVEQVFYGGASTFGTAGGRRLTGDCRKLYDALVPIIRQIASGQRSSTRIGIGQTATYSGTTYIPDVQVTFTGGAPTSKEILNVIYALLSDLPYEMYWFDKTTGWTTAPILSSDGILKYCMLGFTVSENYRAGTDAYETNTAKTSAAANAAANARKIVFQYASGSDRSKLQGYADTICDLVDYDYDAANYGDYAQQIDPWQIIYVFDSDPNTDVVCEGYAKAFMYLCDLSSFTGGTAAYTVGGAMDGGAHMWNIVTLDGSSYLVDVTNYDIGYPLFLVGGSGSVTGGYTVKGIRYVYDSYTKNLWGLGTGSILDLSAEDYSPHSYGAWEQVAAPTPVLEGTEKRVCSLCGHTETRTLEALGLSAPVISASVNAATGTPRIKWSSIKDAQYYRIYRSTSRSGEYEYLKSTSSTAYTDTSARVGKNYYYKVKSVNLDYGKFSGFSNVVNRACDLKQPQVTMKVQTATGKPKLTWEDLSGAIQYRIYRSTSGDGSYSLLKTTTSTTFIDTSASVGQNYYYKIMAIHTNSAANSAYSEAVNRVCDLAKPVVTITRSSGDPKIRWDTVAGAEKYYIYRATSKSGPYTHVKTAITARTYTDTTATAGKTYYYKVKAIHSKYAANSAYSEVKSITAR